MSKGDEDCDNSDNMSTSDDENNSNSRESTENSVEQENNHQSEQKTAPCSRIEETGLDSKVIYCPEESKQNELEKLEDNIKKLDII